MILCSADSHAPVGMGGFGKGILWSWEILYMGRSTIAHINLDGCPLDCKYNTVRSFESPRGDLYFYRNELDTMEISQFIWTPYSQVILNVIAPICIDGIWVWCSRTLIICFDIIALHLPDRVPRQFGMVQHIPDPIDERLPRADRRDREGSNFKIINEAYLARWHYRYNYVVDERSYQNANEELRRYRDWLIAHFL